MARYAYDIEDANEYTNNYTAGAGWTRNSERSVSGTYASKFGGGQTDTTWAYDIDINGTGFASCILTAQIYIEAALDAGEYVCLDYSTNSGSAWNANSGGGTALCDDGAVDTENAWLSFSYNFTSPTSGIRFRGRGSSSATNEQGDMDDIEITCYGYPPAFTVNLADTPDPVIKTNNITFTANASDDLSTRYRLIICSSDSLTDGICDATTYCTSWAGVNTQASCKYAPPSNGSLTVYGFLCDNVGLCSASQSISTTVNNAYPSWAINPADSPDPATETQDIEYTATGIDPQGDQYRLTVCRTNSITDGYPGSCASSQTLCTSPATNSGSQATCNYTVAHGDIGTLTSYSFLCDAGSSTCSDVRSITTTAEPLFGQLAVSITTPGDDDDAIRYGLFRFNATVSCIGAPAATCGNISIYARYNASSSSADTPISTAPAATPFTTSSNPQSSALNGSQSISVSWLVNATGNLGTKYELDIRANSSYGNTDVPEGNPSDITINIEDTDSAKYWNNTYDPTGPGGQWNVSAAASADWFFSTNLNDGRNFNLTVVNTNPSIIAMSINPSMPNTSSNLDCYATILDQESTSLTVYWYWYNSSSLISSGSTPVTNNTNTLITSLGSGNTARGETWNCTIIAQDTDLYSTYNSSVVTIQNALPDKPILLTPTDGNTTYHDRTPFFDWSATDADGDQLNYTINISFASVMECGADLSIAANMSNYTAARDYCVDQLIRWQVRSYDGFGYSDWSALWNFTIESYISVDLTRSSIDFGTMQVLEAKDTDTGYLPLIVENNGNIKINVSRISAESSLWSALGLNTQYFQFKADNTSTEPGSFNWTGSQTTWNNMTGIGVLNRSIIKDLDYNDTHDNAEIDIRVQVPMDEPPGAKIATIYIIGEQS